MKTKYFFWNCGTRCINGELRTRRNWQFVTISGQRCTKSDRGHILGMATNWPRLMPKKAQNVIGLGNEKRRHVIDCQRFVSQPPQNGAAKSGTYMEPNLISWNLCYYSNIRYSLYCSLPFLAPKWFL